MQNEYEIIQQHFKHVILLCFQIRISGRTIENYSEKGIYLSPGSVQRRFRNFVSRPVPMRKFCLETWNMLAKFAKTEGDINARKDDENISLRAIITRAKKFCIDKITTSCYDPFIRMSRYYEGLKSISLADNMQQKFKFSRAYK